MFTVDDFNLITTDKLAIWNNFLKIVIFEDLRNLNALKIQEGKIRFYRVIIYQMHISICGMDN